MARGVSLDPEVLDFALDWDSYMERCSHANLSSFLQLLLVFRSMSGEQFYLSSSCHSHDGHHSQDEQRQLPAVHEGDDNSSAQVGNVLGQRGKSYSCCLSKCEKQEQSKYQDPRGKAVWPVLRLTPWTWAASAASLVVRAPVLFLGLSNQPRSYRPKNMDKHEQNNIETLMFWCWNFSDNCMAVA